MEKMIKFRTQVVMSESLSMALGIPYAVAGKKIEIDHGIVVVDNRQINFTPVNHFEIKPLE